MSLADLDPVKVREVIRLLIEPGGSSKSTAGTATNDDAIVV